MYRTKFRSGVKWTARRIIACVLLLVSFALVFFPWTTISVKIMGQKLTGSDLLSYGASFIGSSLPEVKTDIREEIYDFAQSALYDDGIYIDADKTADAVLTLLDGELTPFSATKVCTAMSSLFRQLKSHIRSSLNMGYPSTSPAMQNFITETSGKATVAAVAMWASVITFFLTFAWAAYSLLTGRRRGLIPYFISSLVLLAVFIVVTVSINNTISSIADTVYYLADGIFSMFGAYNMDYEEIRFFHLTAAGIICVLLIVASYFLSGLGGAVSVKLHPLPVLHISGKWKCGSCGQENSAGAGFCVRCGAKKPTPPSCAKCGRKISEGVLYCPHCGAPTGKPVTSDDGDIKLSGDLARR